MTLEGAPRESQGPFYVLRLLVSGGSPRSTRAVDNLQRLLNAELAGRYDLQVIDINQDPEAARTYQIVAAPTLVRLSPEPVRRCIGDLSDTGKVRGHLGLPCG